MTDLRTGWSSEGAGDGRATAQLGAEAVEPEQAAEAVAQAVEQAAESTAAEGPARRGCCAGRRARRSTTSWRSASLLPRTPLQDLLVRLPLRRHFWTLVRIWPTGVVAEQSGQVDLGDAEAVEQVLEAHLQPDRGVGVVAVDDLRGLLREREADDQVQARGQLVAGVAELVEHRSEVAQRAQDVVLARPDHPGADHAEPVERRQHVDQLVVLVGQHVDRRADGVERRGDRLALGVERGGQVVHRLQGADDVAPSGRRGRRRRSRGCPAGCAGGWSARSSRC